jgi:Multicopper oxidase
MLADNGSVPGPVLRVDQGSQITVQVRNDGDVEATVHWHGLRLENRYDRVPHETQAPIPVGRTFTYQLQFPRRRVLPVPPAHPPRRAARALSLATTPRPPRVGAEAHTQAEAAHTRPTPLSTSTTRRS